MIRSLPLPVLKLSFAPRHFNLALQVNHELLEARFAHGLDPAKRFVENPSLMFGSIRLAGYAADLALIESRARRPHALCNLTLDCQSDRRSSRAFDRARSQRDGLMTKTRRGNQQRRLRFVTPHSFDKFGKHVSHQPRGVRD